MASVVGSRGERTRNTNPLRCVSRVLVEPARSCAVLPEPARRRGGRSAKTSKLLRFSVGAVISAAGHPSPPRGIYLEG